MCQIQASGHVSEGEHLKLFKDADADIGSLLAAAPPQGLAGPRGYDHAIFDPLSLHPFGSQPWIMVGPAPPFPPASTAALQTSMLMDEAHPASSSLFMPSNHLMIANPLPIPSSGDLVCSEGGQGIASQPQSRWYRCNAHRSRRFLLRNTPPLSPHFISQQSAALSHKSPLSNCYRLLKSVNFSLDCRARSSFCIGYALVVP